MHPLALLILPLVQTAPPPMPPPPPGDRQLMPPYLHAARELGLSEDQQVQLKALLDAHHNRMDEKIKGLREAQKALMEVVRGDHSGDLKALNAVFAERHLVVVTEAEKLHAQCLAILTPAQREKAKTLRPPRPEGTEGRPPRGQRDQPERPEGSN